MDKVKITQEQAKAIESKHSREDGQADWSNKDFAEAYILGIGDTQKTIRQLSFENLMLALIVGYEVEETPEDKVRELFNGKRPIDYNVGEVCAYRKGISTTLEALNIKIEGVNA